MAGEHLTGSEPARAEVGDVFILGAGFSRAVSTEMPLTDALGKRAIERAGVQADPRVPKRGFTKGRFETWLSRLAEDQPDLDEARNLENRALFTRLSAALAEVLDEAQEAALADGLPGWLDRLIRAAHVRGSTVLTFNYDTLVERAVDQAGLWSYQAGRGVHWFDVMGDMPPEVVVPGGLAEEGYEGRTVELLKLHGSLNGSTRVSRTGWVWGDHAA